MQLEGVYHRWDSTLSLDKNSKIRENGGSHEIFIDFDLKLFKSGITSPRYF